MRFAGEGTHAWNTRGGNDDATMSIQIECIYKPRDKVGSKTQVRLRFFFVAVVVVVVVVAAAAEPVVFLMLALVEVD